MAGVTHIFIPAEMVSKELKFKIKISDYDNEDATNDIKKLINEYELQLNKNFYYGELLAKIGALPYVNYVVPNQDIFDVILDGKQYLKFTLNIEYI